MLEVIYNDTHTSLAVIDNCSDEKLLFVNKDLYVYESVDYGAISPSNADLLQAYAKAVRAYYGDDPCMLDRRAECVKRFNRFLEEN